VINPLDMTGRSVLVTGASSGLGRAIALTLAQLGAKVVVHGRDRARIDQTLAMLPGTGHAGSVFELANYDDIPAWVGSLVATTGPFSGVVHSAGILTVAPVKVLSKRILGPMMDVNVNAAVALGRGLRTPGNHTKESSLVFLSSVAAFAGSTAQVAYSATKGALVSLTKSMAVEFARERIRVNSVAPATIRTEMVTKYSRSVPQSQIDALEAKHLLGFGQAEDVGNAVAYLLADTGKWITGTTLVVDGGYSAQ
jgi:NAD(P)-dependent dehydrogenase (short-subunit alcohol dehydrogenase family)